MNPKDEVSEPVSPLHSEYHVTSLLEVAQDLVVQGGARGYPGCSFSPAVAGFTLLCLVPTFIAIFYCSFRQFVYVSLVFLLYTLDSRYLSSPPLLVVFTVSSLYFSVSFVRCRIFCRLRGFLSVPACLCILFSPARHLSPTFTPLCSPSNFGCEAKQILHFSE